jgi:hypothetical protein
MSTSHIGKRLFISVGTPTANTAAGFAALTWVEVKGVGVMPQLGVSHAAIDVPDLASGFTRGLKGASTGNDSSMTVRQILADAGQVAIRGLADGGGQAGAGSIRILRPTGTIGSDGVPAGIIGDALQYATGFFHSFLEMQADVTTYEGFTCSFRQNAVTVNATASTAIA